MRRLGLSIYPEKSDEKRIKKYLNDMSKLGFSRVFSCLLSVNKPKDEIIKEFKSINKYAKEKGYEVIVDVAPRVFSELGISYEDLKFFKDINADGLRLDMGFSGHEEAMMTYNKYGLKIEINMSNDTHIIDTIMDYVPNRYNLYGCHNFYPHIYSGLSLDYFKKCTKNFKKYGLKTAAFVSANKEGFGPWPVSDGLVTLEEHRNLSMLTQIKYFIALENIDDILISNCYPSKKDLEGIKDLPLDVLCFDAVIEKSADKVERKAILEELHLRRGDISDYMIRSSVTRVKYKDHDFKLKNAPKIIKRGDIVIDSNLYGHYKGELQIALKDMKNTGKSNVVGHIKEEELVLLDLIKPWQKFRIREIKSL